MPPTTHIMNPPAGAAYHACHEPPACVLAASAQQQPSVAASIRYDSQRDSPACPHQLRRHLPCLDSTRTFVHKHTHLCTILQFLPLQFISQDSGMDPSTYVILITPQVRGRLHGSAPHSASQRLRRVRQAPGCPDVVHARYGPLRSGRQPPGVITPSQAPPYLYGNILYTMYTLQNILRYFWVHGCYHQCHIQTSKHGRASRSSVQGARNEHLRPSHYIHSRPESPSTPSPHYTGCHTPKHRLPTGTDHSFKANMGPTTVTIIQSNVRIGLVLLRRCTSADRFEARIHS